MSVLEPLRRLLLGRPFRPERLTDDALPDGVTLRRGRLVPRIGGLLGGMSGPAAAVTLRRTIVVHPRTRLTQRLLAHELTHVRQWREVRWFPLRYTLQSIRYGYHENRYEREAREVAASGHPLPPARKHT